jgi:hypothetical protein
LNHEYISKDENQTPNFNYTRHWLFVDVNLTTTSSGPQ